MDEMKKYLTSLSVILLVLSAAAERQQYERYQSIVDRQMFGPLPPGFDASKSPDEVQKSASSASQKELSKEQEKVKNSIRFSMINITPEGDTAIGFTDNSDPKVPVHYYMKVGEKRNGWEVKEADADAATMTIVKDGVELSLQLGGESSGGGKDANATSAAPAAGRSSMLSGAGSLRSRRNLRRQQEEAARMEVAEQARKQAEERAAQRAEDEARREEQKAEREEQRKQLMQLTEDLRKMREERQSQAAKESSGEPNE